MAEKKETANEKEVVAGPIHEEVFTAKVNKEEGFEEVLLRGMRSGRPFSYHGKKAATDFVNGGQYRVTFTLLAVEEPKPSEQEIENAKAVLAAANVKPEETK